MTELDAEYHLSFGLHSGVPLCCCEHFLAGNGGGPCSACQEKGISRQAFFDSMHLCHENDPTCQPFLDVLDARTLDSYRERSLYRPVNLTEEDHGDDTWGCSTYRPMGAELSDLLKEDGFRMVHICWPERSVYWYIFQQESGKKGTCGICNVKFSRKFPTTGKQVR